MTQNPNEQILDKPSRGSENPIAEMGESCNGNPCAVTEYPNGEITYNADLVGFRDNSNEGNRNTSVIAQQSAEKRGRQAQAIPIFISKVFHCDRSKDAQLRCAESFVDR